MYIGKYRVLGLLGDGGMGRVYKVELPDIGKISALKLLRPRDHMIDLLGLRAIEDMFIREARILGRLRHPNVAAILDFDRDGQNRPFFSMEYHCMNLGVMIGEHYEMETATRLMDPARTFKYAEQVLSGLDRLHHAGIVHRDIKPYNVLITEDHAVKLIDFGLSLLRGETRRVPDTFKIGTPYYAAPEQQADPDNIDERADLYGVGVMIWRMLTGVLPPEAGKKPRPGSVNELLGEYWDDFLLTATHPQRKNRFSDCRQMQAALEDTYRNWHAQLERACRLQAPQQGVGGTEVRKRGGLRKTALKVQAREARQVFGLDPQWRPSIHKDVVLHPQTPGIVRDVTHGLVWQQAGT
ncbi:MAG: serine/threonine protein kinase, partial [Desulfosalsimonas sp.]